MYIPMWLFNRPPAGLWSEIVVYDIYKRNVYSPVSLLYFAEVSGEGIELVNDLQEPLLENSVVRVNTSTHMLRRPYIYPWQSCHQSVPRSRKRIYFTI